MAGRLAGKVALVSGAARGQGRAHTVRLAEEGADIVAFDVCAPLPAQGAPPATPEDLAATVKAVEATDRRILSARLDATDRPGVQALVDQAVAEFGRIDVVVANAGLTSSGTCSVDTTEEDWRSVIGTNLTGVFNTVTTAVPHMIAAGNGGSVIMTSSSVSLRAVQNLSSYIAAKHGLVGLMRSMALELGEHSIRVNTVHPTAVATDMLLNEQNYRMFRPDLTDPTHEDALPAYRSLHVLPIPYVEAADIAHAVAFLASDEARYITGTVLPVDAGMSIK
ncbi:mycofactocin-coupled SDR family oxidoreductase [Pseudonocardia sp. ICBG1034]|uniref:mycofactocin-coupled SDR family oxidoreductase n=1 Tax=Pseudonocardia sp. ICBG1034 TaxID=2844381 RepID=UPI001CCDA272|nr:mycofactocin-coupled SDR family oxidoreductase [Pseudonocardia sp. ICBG1034]